MQSAKSMRLHLHQAITYKDAPFSFQDASEAYQTLLTYLDDQPIGSEGCLAVTSTANVVFCGVQDPPDEATLEAIRNGIEQPLREGSNQLEPGSYEFFQLAPLQTFEQMLQCIPMLFDGPSRIYLRLIKENSIAIVAQIWVVR